MANTYIKIYLHLVFAVKRRTALIASHWQNRVYSHMRGIITSAGHYPLTIGGTEDHVHILLSFSGKTALPDFVRELKTSCTKFINNQRITPFRFEWQSGYGCFSYSNSQLDAVSAYINNQQAHHKKDSLQGEIKHMLERFGVEYDEKYIFEEPQ